MDIPDPPPVEWISVADLRTELAKRKEAAGESRDDPAEASGPQFKRPKIKSARGQRSYSAGISYPSFQSAVLNWKQMATFTPFPDCELPRDLRQQAEQALRLRNPTFLRDPAHDLLMKRLRNVRDTYMSCQDYGETMLPLCLEETLSQVISAMQSTGEDGVKRIPRETTIITKDKPHSNKSTASDRIHLQGHTNLAARKTIPIRLRFPICTEVRPNAELISHEAKDVKRRGRSYATEKELRHIRSLESSSSHHRTPNQSFERFTPASSLKRGDLVLVALGQNLNCSFRALLARKTLSVFAIVTRNPAVSCSAKKPSQARGAPSQHTLNVSVDVQVEILDRQWGSMFGDNPKTAMSVWSIANLITGWREYDAISTAIGLDVFALRTPLLSGRNPDEDATITDPTAIPGVTPRFREHLEASYNASQLAAIDAASTRTSGFTLVQGPPGTGKTHTLLGMLNSLHLSVFQRYYENSIPSLDRFSKDRYKSQREIEENRMFDTPRILVTAPSNTAIDGIAKLIMSKGFVDGTGNKYFPNMVRVGSGTKDRALQDISVEQQVDNVISYHVKFKGIDKVKDDIRRLRGDMREFTVRLRQLTEQYRKLDKLTEEDEDGRFDNDRKQLVKDYHHLAAKLTHTREQFTHASYLATQSDIINGDYSSSKTRALLRTHVLEKSHLILSTLSGSALRNVIELGDKVRFKVVVVDEAAQAVEPSVLIPLQHGAEHCVLVGDHQQLPATVMSDVAKKFKYEQSMFERLQDAGCDVHLLDTQYRCHPSISEFSSKQFYHSKLKNGDNVMSPTYQLPCHQIPAFGPLVFYDMVNGRARQDGGNGLSWGNTVEADMVVRLYQTLRELQRAIDHRSEPWGIGVITPYARQLEIIRRKFREKFGPQELQSRYLNTNTVDGYQGREFDIIIVSCVRADPDGAKRRSIGFLNDARRLNVAITRAKYSLFVVGQQSALEVSHLWKRLMEHCRKRGHLFKIKPSVEKVVFAKLV